MSASRPEQAPFEHTVRIRFYQADPAAVLFYGRIFELVQETFEELLRATGLDVDGWLNLRTFATPIVHAEADYRRPIQVGEAVTVHAVIEHIGTSSLAMAYTVLGPQGDLRATARVVHVFVDGRSFTKTAIPDEVRARLESAPWHSAVPMH